MMGFRGWYTKDDVLNDLIQVNGRPFDFDDNFIVEGERPPPPRTFDEDTEEELRLRYGSECDNNEEKSITSGPDLQGITKLLREIDSQDGDEDSDGEYVSPEGNILQPKDAVSIVSISKLNPNVQEFVPKSTQSSSDSNCDNSSVVDKNSETKEKPSINGIKETASELRDKINTSSKKSCMKSKKEKNVAIAALMKLSSSSPRSISPIKLFTPQYFAETKASHSNINDKNCDTKRPETPIAPAVPDPIVMSSNAGQTQIIPDETTVKESIDKVESWLEGPQCSKPKQPVLMLGAVTFKKKEIRNNSPSSEASESKSSKHKDKFKNYVPSSYVDDLCKKFDKQKKQKAETLDVWTKLENELKERDQKILKEKQVRHENEEVKTPTKNDETASSQDDSS